MAANQERDPVRSNHHFDYLSPRVTQVDGGMVGTERERVCVLATIPQSDVLDVMR